MKAIQYVVLSRSDIADARAWSDRILGLVDGRVNRAGSFNVDRYYIGFLGEIGFARWANANGLIYKHNINLDGQSSEPEFVILRDGRWETFDVKAAKAGNGVSRMLSPIAGSRLDSDWYIGAVAHDDGSRLVALHGVISRDEFLSAPPVDVGHGPSHCFMLKDLPGMDEFFADFDRRREVRGG